MMTRTLRTASRAHRVLVYSLAASLADLSRVSRLSSVQDSSRFAPESLSPASRPHHKNPQASPSRNLIALTRYITRQPTSPSPLSGKFFYSFPLQDPQEFNKRASQVSSTEMPGPNWTKSNAGRWQLAQSSRLISTSHPQPSALGHGQSCS